MSARHTDLLPTLLEVLDLRRPETLDGIALLSSLDDQPDPDRPLSTL
ncbi:MAG: hypothetical protein V3T22_14290 [Planctomycetota bacterium]